MIQPHEDLKPYMVPKADVDSFSQTPARLTEGHLTLEAALGLCWRVLACLGLSCLCCLVSGTQIKNKLSGPELFFSSPHLLSNLIPRQNELSSPAMVEYLALSSVWKACD